jgi:hypothetical protein
LSRVFDEIYEAVKNFSGDIFFGLKIDGRLYNLKKEVSVQDSKHRKTLAEVSLWVSVHVFESF